MATHLYGEVKVKDGDPTGPILLQGDHTGRSSIRHVRLKPIKSDRLVEDVRPQTTVMPAAQWCTSA